MFNYFSKASRLKRSSKKFFKLFDELKGTLSLESRFEFVQKEYFALKEEIENSTFEQYGKENEELINTVLEDVAITGKDGNKTEPVENPTIPENDIKYQKMANIATEPINLKVNKIAVHAR